MRLKRKKSHAETLTWSCAAFDSFPQLSFSGSFVAQPRADVRMETIADLEALATKLNPVRSRTPHTPTRAHFAMAASFER